MKKAVTANFPQFEEDMLKTWEKEGTFAQSLENRKSAVRFSFYDGPPFANGLPHYGHVVPVTIKDAITRYKTMCGYLVPRRNGWDTHGLPVEYEIEKELGLKGKREIYDYGVEKFIEDCRASVFKYRTEWEEFFDRIGRWADKQNAYATLDPDYIESVWWAIKQLHEKELLYESFRSMPYCPRCATPLSNFEVNQNYKDDTPDPSVYVKFQLVGHADKSFLVWTTTPWTLPANAALAVDPAADYVEVELLDAGDGWKRGEKLILAKQRLSVLDLKKMEYKILNTKKGKDCVGATYEPLYPVHSITKEEKAKAYRVYTDDSVDLEDGTGILHVAPRYGETDLAMGQRLGLPLIESVDGFGRMVDALKKEPGLESVAGLWFKDADPLIIEDLTKQGRIFAAETFTHTYPFCWRCDRPLMYFATPTWNIRVTKLVKNLVKNNEEVSWVPEHIKEGRFGNWLADARDWGISRNRFWGNPLPIWRNDDDPKDIIVIGGLDELKELSGDVPSDLHRPAIDKVKIIRDGKTYSRVEEVLDCWFESGAMPFAQDHYPFEHKADFDSAFPADFIAEGLDQTRGWFYTLHVLATALFEKPAYKHVVVNGLVLAADGQKMSKRLKNYPPLSETFDRYGADVLRFFMMSSPVVAGEGVRFADEALADVQRNVFLRLWNVHSFFTTYAEIDGWKPGKALAEPKSDNVLDTWLLARLNQTITEMTEQADAYQIARAVRPLRELIDDLSNWYVRRSRRRFWKSEDDGDKRAAYATLHYALVRITQLLAPWSPFVADRLWRELTTGMEMPPSVHLSDWPSAPKDSWHPLIRDMDYVREAITIGLAQRAQFGIKVRQPLAKATIWDTLDPEDSRANQFGSIIREELNVKELIFERSGDQQIGNMAHIRAELDTTITPELAREGMMRDVVRQVQDFRKKSGLAVEDRIELALDTDDKELAQAVKEHSKTIAAETLANKVSEKLAGGYETTVKLGEAEMKISLKKL